MPPWISPFKNFVRRWRRSARNYLDVANQRVRDFHHSLRRGKLWPEQRQKNVIYALPHVLRVTKVSLPATLPYKPEHDKDRHWRYCDICHTYGWHHVYKVIWMSNCFVPTWCKVATEILFSVIFLYISQFVCCLCKHERYIEVVGNERKFYTQRFQFKIIKLIVENEILYTIILQFLKHYLWPARYKQINLTRLYVLNDL